MHWKRPSGQKGLQWDRIFIPAQRSGKGGTNSMPSPTRILHTVSIAAQQQTFFPFHKKAWLTLYNYISQRFNQILSSLELAILFLLISSLCNAPEFSSRMAWNVEERKLRVFFSFQSCPSAATVGFFLGVALCPHGASSCCVHGMPFWSEKAEKKPQWQNPLNQFKF